MTEDSIQRVSFDGKIWNSVLEESSNKLYLEIREENKETVLVQIDLQSLSVKTKQVPHSKWTQLMGVKNDDLYFVEYKDDHDPNVHESFRLSWSKGTRESVAKAPTFSVQIGFPNIYEQGTEYHKTVSDFLSLELPHACEYLEWQNKIIISYYLRSGNAFERYLLLLQEGEKKWKVCQDKQMKGFSPGAFFVFRDQLIFIKDQNEVCVYTG